MYIIILELLYNFILTFISKTEALKKPWKWQKKIYQNMEFHLDAAIDKVENLSLDVRVNEMMEKWDSIYERNKTVDGARTEQSQPLEVQAVADGEEEYAVEVEKGGKERKER